MALRWWLGQQTKATGAQTPFSLGSRRGCWELPTPHAERTGLYFIDWFGSASTEKNNYKASICPFPPHPEKPTHFVPFQLSALQPTLSPLVVFQESCRVWMKQSVAASTPALIGPSTSSHFTLKINREPWGLRQADWNNQSQMLFQSSGSLVWNSRCPELSHLWLETSLHLKAKFMWLLYYPKWVNK